MWPAPGWIQTQKPEQNPKGFGAFLAPDETRGNSEVNPSALHCCRANPDGQGKPMNAAAAARRICCGCICRTLAELIC